MKFSATLRPGMHGESFDSEEEMIEFAQKNGYEIYHHVTLLKKEYVRK